MLATQKSFITRALARLGSENAFQILQRAREIEATGRRVVHMEIGEPDFDTPDNIKRAAVDSLLAHDTHYTPSQGTHELREVVAEYASRFRKMATPLRTSRSHRARSRSSGISSRRFSIRATSSSTSTRRIPRTHRHRATCRPTLRVFRCTKIATGAWTSTNFRHVFPIKQKR